MDTLVFYYPEGHQAHFEPGHPERPERVEAICQALEQAGWWGAFPHLSPLALSDDLLKRIHSPGYFEQLRSACSWGVHLDPDTYSRPASWQLALNAAGGAAAVAAAVWKGEAKRGIALTRPPGHHATRNQGLGFCLLNNVALAAEYLLTGQEMLAKKASRLAIIDLDLHHGNGTQDIFWSRADVLYISTHQSPLYPGSGFLEERGAGPGAGLTANFPLPPGTGDQGFQVVMRKLILPLLDRYQPEMLLVSYGFDTHWRDPLGSLTLSAGGYGSLITDLVGWADRHCDGKIALFLEGGYDLDAARVCSLAVIAALLGETSEDALGPAPSPEYNGWQKVLSAAQSIWNLDDGLDRGK